MAEIIRMPKLSDTMVEAVVAEWHKKIGDTVEEGELIAEIETDKATMEFESFFDGVLLHIGVEKGKGAPVNDILAIIGEKGEDISALLEGAKEAPNTEEKENTNTGSTEVKEETKSNAAEEIPDGAEIITMPRLSDTMTEGTVATWLKKEGDPFLLEITDKELAIFLNGLIIEKRGKRDFSITITSMLCLLSKAAASEPEGPAPIMAT